MSQRLRLATFNFENLFTRAKVLNLADHESATSILAQIADLEELLAKARYNLAKDWVVVAGDLNDTPDSKPLAPLLGLPRLHDVLALQFPGRPQDRWTYAYGSQRHQIDYLLVSDPLKAAFKGAELERRGLHDLRRLTGATPFPSVTSPANAASDHCAIVAEFEA